MTALATPAELTVATLLGVGTRAYDRALRESRCREAARLAAARAIRGLLGAQALPPVPTPFPETVLLEAAE